MNKKELKLKLLELHCNDDLLKFIEDIIEIFIKIEKNDGHDFEIIFNEYVKDTYSGDKPKEKFLIKKNINEEE